MLFNLYVNDLSSALPSGVVSHFPRGGGGVLSYKSDGGARRKISRTPLKGTIVLFYGCVPNSLPPLRGTNSTTTHDTTGTANFNSNKDDFGAFSSQERFESIVINFYPNQSF